MTRKELGICLACVAVGAIGGALFMKHKEKIKPMAAEILAKSMHLKEKAADCAARAREHAEDIVAEAKHINEKSPRAKS